MKKRLLPFLFLALLLLPLPVQAESNRAKWLRSIEAWVNIMENDGNWIYVSGSNEITDYQKNRNTQRYSNCALMVSHALQYMGVLKTNQKIYAQVSKTSIKTVYSGTGTEAAIKKYCDVIHIGGTKTSTDLIKNGTLQKGDIVCYYGMQHTVVYWGTVGNNSYWYDAGRSGTSTKQARGYWNKTYSLKRLLDARYLTSDSFKVNEIIRFRDLESISSPPSTPSVEKIPEKTTEKVTVPTAKTSHVTPTITKLSYKIKKKRLYVSFTVTNKCSTSEKITVSTFLGSKNALGKGIKKTVTLKAGKSKRYSNLLVNSNKVTTSRRYMTLRIKCHGKTIRIKQKKLPLK